jgi:hypothetical protein
MKKTDNFFVISNYNVDPENLFRYANDYIVYDQSDDPLVIEKNKAKKDSRIFSYPNTGHNHIVFFKYLVDNYDNLPERVAFLKGNVIGRHVTQEFWDKNYDNSFYTFLWQDPKFIDKPGIAYSLGSGQLIEKNNNWFVTKSTHRYFTGVNQLISFFYESSFFPEYNLFAPGGCYIVERERILRNPKTFYLGLIKIMDYAFFPSEVWMVERLMHYFFTTDTPLKQYVYDETKLMNHISDIPDNSNLYLGRNRLKEIFRHKMS